MKKKAIWYCTGCKEKCAVKITDGYEMYKDEDDCILFTEIHCKAEGYKPNWRKHEPKVKMPF